jgi:hypothetical protein
VGDDFRAAGRSYSSVMLGMREYEDWQALGRDLIARGLAASVLDTLNTELVIVGVDEALAQRAGELADERALRGHEAVHLASALGLPGGDDHGVCRRFRRGRRPSLDPGFRRLKWRDPDSNRGHHDFQKAGTATSSAQEVLQIRRLPSGLVRIMRGFWRCLGHEHRLVAQSMLQGLA